ncbi:MAG: CPBP family intramembrane glutamic endopeptidase [Bacillota bacterium]
MDNTLKNGSTSDKNEAEELNQDFSAYKRKPGLKSVMRLYVVVFLILLVVGSIVQGWNLEIGMLITQWILILLPAIWILTRYRVDRTSFIRLNPLKFDYIPVIILLSASFWLLNMVIAAGLVTGLTEFGYEPVVVLEPPQTFQHYLIYLLAIAVSAGICEEVLFRGTILPAIEEHGVIPAIIFSSLLFALFHGSFLNLISTFMLGAVIAVVVIKTGSLWGGVLYHMLNNFYAITYLYLVGQQETATEVDPQAFLGLIPLLLLGLVLAYFSLRLLHSKTKTKSLLKNQEGRWLPKGWFSGLMIVSLILFLAMAMLELAIGFGWFGINQF